MLLTTEAFILSRIKYSDTSLILKAYTKNKGISSFIVKGVRNKKKGNSQALFHPFSWLKVEYVFKETSQLYSVRNFNTIKPMSFPFDMYKSSIVVFLAEVLLRYIKEEEANPELYTLVTDTIVGLDEAPNVHPNFVLKFVLSLSEELGIKPNMENRSADTVFCIHSGSFVSSREVVQPLAKEENEILMNFVDKKDIQKMQRRKLLRSMIRYLDYHLSTSGNLKSLEVLEQISD